MQAAWFLLSPTQQQLVGNPVVSDMVQEWWEMAAGCGILGTRTCMNSLKVDCSRVRHSKSETGAVEFKPLRIERRK